MPIDLSLVNFATAYRTGAEDLVADFYKPCLSNSIEYKRAVGYFSSSVYLIIGDSIIDFARRGGKIKLICSPILSQEDVESIEQGYCTKANVTALNLSSELDRMLTIDDIRQRTIVLATLISLGILEIKIAFRSNEYGQYHEKIGIFCDPLKHIVSFIGSVNETWNGWHLNGNLESIEVFCNWKDARESNRVKNHNNYFDLLWQGQTKDVEVIAFPEVIRQKLKIIAYESLDQLADSTFDSTQKQKNLFEVSAKRQPSPHQIEAIKNWLAQGGQGILEHATGSGKTFTAIQAIRQHVESFKPVIVLVPSALLLEQWSKEILYELPEATKLLVGDGNNKWRIGNRLRSMTANDSSLGQRITVATMQTAATDDFISRVVQGNHLLMVVDEVHQIGSNKNSKALQINAGFRLGLSATPKRYGDKDGTNKIFQYFKAIVPPRFTLLDAIKSGRLVEYLYYPYFVNLTITEKEDWHKLTVQIKKEVVFARKPFEDTAQLSDKLKILLVKRSKIAKKAILKIPLAISIVEEHYEQGQSWLVYCEDLDQMTELMNELTKKGFQPIAYYSAMQGDKRETLSAFASLGGVMVSVRCLDEGVDIPNITHALIIASSQNPRQFIQRRGRVLRRAINKHFAYIYDVLVLPNQLSDDFEFQSLIESEITRAHMFADFSKNKSAKAEISGKMALLGIDFDKLIEEGLEENG